MNRKALFALCILGLCASAFTATPPPTPTLQARQTPPATAAPALPAETNSETNLRELILRLIPLGLFGVNDRAKPEVVVGQLPALFPSEMKLPAGARVLGGLFQGQSAARAALDAPQSPDEAVNIMKASLLAAGWTEPPQMTPGGFQSMPMPAASTFLCKSNSKGGPGLSLRAEKAAAGNGAAVQLTIDTYEQMPGNYSPCNPQAISMPNPPPKLPMLTPPAGVRSRGGGGGGGDISYSSYISLDTDQAVADLRAFYDAQLQRAGWTRTTQGVEGSVAWSVWRFNDDKGRAQSGILLVNGQVRDGTPTREMTLQVAVSR